MKITTTSLLAVLGAYLFAANASAMTYPQSIGAQYDDGWDLAYWSAGEITTTYQDSTWTEYGTYKMPQYGVNAVHARTAKWGGDGTGTYSYYDDWYLEYPVRDTLAEACPSGQLAIFGKTNEYVCGAVDASGSTGLGTCYDDDGVSHSCRYYQFSEFGAYDDTNIYTYWDEGAGFHRSRFGLMKYRYVGSTIDYYRTFVIYNIIS